MLLCRQVHRKREEHRSLGVKAPLNLIGFAIQACKVFSLSDPIDPGSRFTINHSPLERKLSSKTFSLTEKMFSLTKKTLANRNHYHVTRGEKRVKDEIGTESLRAGLHNTRKSTE